MSKTSALHCGLSVRSIGRYLSDGDIRMYRERPLLATMNLSLSLSACAFICLPLSIHIVSDRCMARKGMSSSLGRSDAAGPPSSFRL